MIVELPEPPEATVTLPGERFVLRWGDDVAGESVTLPANPFRLVRDIVDVAEPPRGIVNEDGLAEILKSPEVDDVTVSAIVVLWDKALLVPVIVME